jgi:phosphate transport system substrate-binding protein
MKFKTLGFLLLFITIICAACQSKTSETATSSETSSGDVTYIENKGSDTMVNIALAWAERYQEIHPDIRVSVTGGGSGTGLASLSNGTVDIANASRAISDEEIALAETKGFTPFEQVVARDAIAVIVNPANPVNELTIEQISRIYKGEITNWQQLGGEDRPIVMLSRETNSGTHVYFLDTVIRKGDSEDKSIFSASTLLLPSSEGIIAEVRDNPNAIGYDGLGYVIPEVKTIAIAKVEGEPYVQASVATVSDGTYPIARDLYMYFYDEPQGIEKDYLDWILSAEAQEIVSDLGFVPIVAVQ